MIIEKDNLKITTESNSEGTVKLLLSDLADFEGKNGKLRTFALAELLPGEEVEFHIHEGESEQYYIISGEGEYNDNGKIIPIYQGTSTFTPSGEGHGIKNTGSESLKFIALIILD